MKTKHDVLVFGEERVVLPFSEAVGMLCGGLELHQIDDIDNPNFQFGQMLAQEGNSSENLQGGCVAAAGHDHVRLAALVVAGPLPDAETFGAVDDRLIHSQPLRQSVLSCNHHVDVIAASQAGVENRKKAV